MVLTFKDCHKVEYLKLQAYNLLLHMMEVSLLHHCRYVEQARVGTRAELLRGLEVVADGYLLSYRLVQSLL